MSKILAPEISKVVAEAQRGIRKIWIVCPSRLYADCRTMLIGCSPSNTEHEDGASYFPGGSQIHLTTLESAPQKNNYEVYIIDDGSDLPALEEKNRRIWRQNARCVLNNQETSR